MAKPGELDWSHLVKSSEEYELSHSMSPKGVLTVVAKHPTDGIVGKATFSHDGTTDKIFQANRKQFNIRGLMPENTEVHANHRRKGVATKMYELAGKVMNQKIIRPPQEHQTEDAKLMWQTREKLGKSWPEWTDNDINKVFGGGRIQLQATNEQLFGHLVVSENTLNKAEQDYQNKLNNWYSEVNKNIDNKDIDWADGKSFNDSLTEEERLRRNMHLGNDGDF